jgi:hypothetical protein
MMACMIHCLTQTDWFFTQRAENECLIKTCLSVSMVQLETTSELQLNLVLGIYNENCRLNLIFVRIDRYIVGLRRSSRTFKTFLKTAYRTKF